MLRFSFRRTKLLIGLALLGAVSFDARPIEAQVHYVPTAESRVWIEGTSNAQDFTCATDQIEGQAQLPEARLIDARPSDTTLTLLETNSAPEARYVRTAVFVTAPEEKPTAQATPTSQEEVAFQHEPALRATVPVEALDCGKRRQNRDLYEAMKSDRYPTIHYKLRGVEALGKADSTDGLYALRATGELIIAGERQTVQTKLVGRRLDADRVRARGSMPLKMSDFGIDPPTALLGLIRVADEIEVRFDITAVATTDRP